MDYLYDGSFEGLLTCVYHHYYTDKASGIYQEGEYQQQLMRRSFSVRTDEALAERVYRALESKLTAYDIRRIYRVFLSCAADREMIILNYIRLGFVRGSDVWKLHADPIVYEFQQIDRQVANEAHRLKGLVRFSYLEGGIAYSGIEPDHQILELLADHFADRLKNNPFIIHDIRRNRAVVASGGIWYLTYFTGEELPELCSDEKKYQSLWKKYFETIAIRERTNPRCRRNMMPARYHRHLTEIK